ncbi:hypothetical protein WAZ07_00570 [Bacillus sp. FJAT-51639]|uniref:Uncharacterized protein n=1 Tax=Bacillus bruguierae TaxID=3127667 RepID=A0ABU8FAX1_9BACI
MLKELGIGLITSTFLLSTNGIADASTNSLYAKGETVTNNAQIKTLAVKSLDIGESKFYNGIAAEPIYGWPDVIEIYVRDGEIEIEGVGKGKARVMITKKSGQKVYYNFEVN